MAENEAAATGAAGEVTKVVSGDSTYNLRDAGALRDAEGSVATANLADGAVTEDKLSESVNEVLEEVPALRDSLSRKRVAVQTEKVMLPAGRGSWAQATGKIDLSGGWLPTGVTDAICNSPSNAVISSFGVNDAGTVTFNIVRSSDGSAPIEVFATLVVALMKLG